MDPQLTGSAGCAACSTASEPDSRRGPGGAGGGGGRARHIYWYLSFRCNLSCAHCSVESSPHVDTSNDLTTEACFQVVDQMRELGVASAMLTGGEVLLRGDAFQIMDRLATAGIHIGLETNGLRFNDAFVRAARPLQAAGRLSIAVSVDGGTAETHEVLRGAGTFARTLRGLRLLAGNGIRFDVQAVLNRASYTTIGALYALADELAPQMETLRFAFLNPVGRGSGVVEELGVRRGEYERIFTDIAAAAPRSSVRTVIKCPPALVPPHHLAELSRHPRIAKSSSCQFPLLGVLPNGDVTICAVSRTNDALFFGNVTQRRLVEIWELAGLDQVRERYSQGAHLTGVCGDCVWKKTCRGGCRAWAFEEGGSFEAPLPVCRAVAERGDFPTVYRLSSHARAVARQDRSRVTAPDAG